MLAEAGISPDGVGHIHAHGLSTRTGDAEEAAAIHAVFGRRAKPVPVVAAKSHFGNLGAGSGMVELVASVLALGHGHLFPVLNYQTPDPECPVAAVTDADTPSGDSFVNLSVTPKGRPARSWSNGTTGRRPLAGPVGHDDAAIHVCLLSHCALDAPQYFLPQVRAWLLPNH